MGKLIIYGCSFSDHDPYGWTHRLQENFNLPLHSHALPGQGFIHLRDVIIRTATEWKEDDLVIIQNSFLRRMYSPYYDEKLYSQGSYDWDEYIATKFRQPLDPVLRDDLKNQPEMIYSHVRAEVNWYYWYQMIPLLRLIKPTNLFIWLTDGEWWDGHVTLQPYPHYHTGKLKTPHWEEFIEQHGDILLRFGEGREYSCYMEWLGNETLAIRDTREDNFDLHQSQWGYRQQAKWFEEQIRESKLSIYTP